ncbi:MAG: type II toxin-antitoxin system RelE/ParE family toxin [Prolixibacteraceae bacterium]
MAQRKIIWSHRASVKLLSILEFYTERNKSKDYAKKLHQKFNKELQILLKQPNLGLRTEMETVRGLIVDEFILFYEFDKDHIIIHTVWDCRQKPDDQLYYLVPSARPVS